ncbi:MAG TPA: bifunctional (p)ppGpp synthetase/guanosine-3',5'-bis(diphosphate) 3'-pyrophosphohydrolase [Gammaproteobacteria bacterium]|nr:bifunctional (p)ppGpp synthetase/guanosine-3',5'-bis(diphosphate) 3'-pyrophosphohydrolase [Gammaproteobacteria bacterium]
MRLTFGKINMKRESANQWSNSFELAEVQLIQSALLFCENKKNTEAKTDKRQRITDILDHIHVDCDTIVAAILLIGLENQDFDHQAIEKVYSPSICNLAIQSQSLIKLESDWIEKLKGDLEESDSSEHHHMMLLNMMKDARAVFILLAYQVLKMQDLANKPKEEQRRVAQETNSIFAPLANRLGIGQLKWELEDLAFRYLHPDEYKKIAKALEERRIDRENYIHAIVDELQVKLSDAGLEAEVYGRVKHIFSIWKKMQKKDLKFEDLYDVRALRVMVKDLSACYTALSIVHDLWQFIPSEYDDYVAAPKSNNYQSLHTAVLGPENKTLEIQIRTHEMHAHAELGVAAHWRYKEGGKRDEDLEKQLASLREAINRTESPEPQQKLDCKPSKIYVLSPKGHVIELPYGSTPLDFAYYVHSEVGNRCRGAKVNGKMVPLTSTLLNGQTVEIITAKDAKPSRDWLVPHFGYLKSPRARSKVRAWFKREFREEHISAGKLALTKHVSILPSNMALKMLAESFNMCHADDLYAAIGRGELGVNQVLNSLKIPEEKIKETPFVLSERQDKKIASDIAIEGVDDLMTNLARCCKPLPTDKITGFITQGRGVSIHRQDCKNLLALKKQYPQRLVDVSWKGTENNQNYEVDVEIIALDRSGLLRDVMSVMSANSINVNAANTFTDKRLQQAKMRLTLEISDPAQLTTVLGKLVNVRGILEARRIK